MQKSVAIAMVLGALIIAAALIYHGHQLAQVSRQLQAMEQRTAGMENRLKQFSDDLPGLVEQAGNNAGRQAVHGMVEEAVQMPLNWWRTSRLNRDRPHPTSPKPAASSSTPSSVGTNSVEPWIRFDIRKPVVQIEILPNLKNLPATN